MGTEQNPDHYKMLNPEPIEIIESWNVNSFHLGNVLKYVGRYISKGNLVDLKKARVYLDRFIARQETGHKQDINKTNETPNWEPCVIKYTSEDGCVVIPNNDFTATSQYKYTTDVSGLHPHEIVSYRGVLYEYQYTDGDNVYLTKVGGSSKGTEDTAPIDNRAPRAYVDGLG